MRDGSFVPTHALDDHINARQTDYEGARAIINTRDIGKAATIAAYARDWEVQVHARVRRIQSNGNNVTPQTEDKMPAMLLEMGRAHVGNQVTNEHLESSIQLEKQKTRY